MRPILSIIIPSYNRKKLLTRCLKSINRKTKDFEVIVVDDGSNYDLKILSLKYYKIFKIKNSGDQKHYFMV